MGQRRGRIWAKAIAVSGLLGVFAGAAVYSFVDQIPEDWLRVFRAYLDWLLDFAEVISWSALFTVVPSLRRAPGIKKTAISVTAGISTAVTAMSLLLLGRRPLVDLIWPEPPDILGLKLFRQDQCRRSERHPRLPVFIYRAISSPSPDSDNDVANTLQPTPAAGPWKCLFPR